MFSRLGRSSIFAGGRSLYETLRQQDDDDSDSSDDLEAGVGLRAVHHDEDFGRPDNYELRPPLYLTGSQYPQTEDQISAFNSEPQSRADTGPNVSSRLDYMSPQATEPESEAEEVPASLLVERTGSGIREPYRDSTHGLLSPPHSTMRHGGPTRTAAHPHWAVPEPVQRREEGMRDEEIHQARMGLIDPKQRALWKWANVENLDNFFHDVRRHPTVSLSYMVGLTTTLGLPILSWKRNIQYMSRSFSELDVGKRSTQYLWRKTYIANTGYRTSAFVVGFTTFLTNCVDYSHKEKESHTLKLSDVVKPNCTAQ